MPVCRAVKVERMGDGPNMLVTLRGEDGKRYLHYERNYRPYFYIECPPDEKPDAYSLLGKVPLWRKDFSNAKKRMEARTEYDATWEGDVPDTQQYMVWKNLFAYCDETATPAPPEIRPTIVLKNLWFDIETAEPTKQAALDTKNTARIVSVAFFNGTEFTTFAYSKRRQTRVTTLKGNVTDALLKGDKKTQGERKEYPWRIEEYETEEAMLRAIWLFIKAEDPDNLIGFNSGRFDWPMMVNRSKAKKVSSRGASYTGWISENTCGGRQLVDVWQIYIWTLLQKERDTSLAGVSKKHGLAMDKSMQANVYQAWVDGRYEDIILYNTLDVEATWFVDIRERLSNFGLSMQEVTGVDEVMDVTKASIVADVLCLRESKRMNRPLPTRDTEANERYAGASVLDPRMGGKLEDVEVYDFSRLYPSLIVALNISPETLVDGERHEWPEIPGLEAVLKQMRDKNPKKAHLFQYPFCWKFTTTEKGLMPRVVEYSFELRDMCERERDAAKAAGRTSEAEEWELRAQATKKIINGIYGALGYKDFRLYMKELAESVTGSGRYLINMVDYLLRQAGYIPIYGDTDSLFVKGDGSNRDAISQSVNEAVAKASAMMGVAKPMKIKHEKTYMAFLIIPGTKKRYAGYISFKDGKYLPVPKYEVKGFDEKRSDSARVTATTQHHIFDMILRDEPRAAVLEAVVEEIRKIAGGKYPVEDCVRMPSVSKPLHEYPTTNQLRRACEYANKWLGANFQKDDRAMLVYVKGQPKGVPPTEYIALAPGGQFPEGFQPDWKTLASKAIGDKFGEMFEAIGWQHEALRCWSPFNQTLDMFGGGIAPASADGGSNEEEEDD